MTKSSDMRDRSIQWHLCAPCNPSGLHRLLFKLTAHRDWPLNGDDFIWSSARAWPEAGPSKIPVSANAANAYRDDMKCSEKSYKQQFTWATSQLADDKIEAPCVDLRNGNTMVAGFLLTLNTRNSLRKI
jgi:hypothetical protein